MAKVGNLGRSPSDPSHWSRKPPVGLIESQYGPLLAASDVIPGRSCACPVPARLEEEKSWFRSRTSEKSASNGRRPMGTLAIPADDKIAIGVAILTALTLVTVWWLWWWLPKREVARLSLKIRDAKARAEVENNIRKTVGQALGGAVVLLGTATAYLQFAQQQRSSHDLLISDQVSKGFEQLGSEKVVVRLGGIYALEGVMNNSHQYHQPVLEALTAFVREGTRAPRPSSSLLPRTDIQPRSQ